MEKELRESIGKKILKKRIEHGLSRESFAEMVGITPRFLFDIEIGKKGMSFNTFNKMRKILGVSADWLLDEET